jgi:two-component system sensor histidine kinase QseC
MRPSIQARLIVLSLLAVFIVGLATVWIGYGRAVHEVDEVIDAQLVQYARIMLALAHEAEDDEVEPPDIQGHPYASRLLFQIWQREHGRDTLLLRSPAAPDGWPEGVARVGYSDAAIGGVAWRVFSASDNGGERIALAALDLHIRDELVRDIVYGSLVPYLAGLPILAVLLFVVIRHGLAPLRRMEAELASRSGERLDPLSEDGAPREIHPLLLAMNRLFGRVSRTLDNERRFTSDAAHELRTPLAALKAQLQVAGRTPDAAERQAAIAKAERGADRMAHLVGQLLSLARLEGTGDGLEMGGVPLGALLAEVVEELRPLAEQRGIRIDSELAPAAGVTGNPDLLRILARNLVDNALRYGGEGGRVKVSLDDRAGRLEMRVADAGPGVAAAERDKLGLRFHRFGPQRSEGVGLGLSIVRRIAELHGAALQFGEGLDGRGLGVTVRFTGTAPPTRRHG